MLNSRENLASSSKPINAVNPKSIELPYSCTPKEKAPGGKYFIPASLEKSVRAVNTVFGASDDAVNARLVPAADARARKGVFRWQP